MVGGLPGILQEIERRILATKPSLYSTDYYMRIDMAGFEGESNTIPIYFRHFSVELPSIAPGDFAGGYVSTQKNLSINVVLYYSAAGATRVLSDPDLNFNSFIAQDVIDIEERLLDVIDTDDGTTGRLIRNGAVVQVETDETGNQPIVKAILSYTMPTLIKLNTTYTVPVFGNPQ